MKWSLSSILRTLTWMAAGLSVLAIGLGRYAPRTRPDVSGGRCPLSRGEYALQPGAGSPSPAFSIVRPARSSSSSSRRRIPWIMPPAPPGATSAGNFRRSPAG